MDKDNKLTQKITYAGESITYSGTWDFNDDKTQLQWTTGGDVQSFEIKRLTNKELWLDDDLSSVDGDIIKLEAK
jgi:hypothetical protein